MENLEDFVAEQIKKLESENEAVQFKDVQFNAVISSKAYSVEFFATVDGKKMQCFDMIDQGMFTEKKFDEVSEVIVNHIRKLPDFKSNDINKYSLTFTQL